MRSPILMILSFIPNIQCDDEDIQTFDMLSHGLQKKLQNKCGKIKPACKVDGFLI
jgi:hypothetical protein